MNETRKPRRGRPSTLDARKVIEVAVNAYWHADPADVSVNAICQMAAISKPSLYREFGSEDGLSRAALDSYADDVLTDLFAILQGGLPLRETLAALIEFASADPRFETGCLFYKMRAGKHRLGPKTLERVEEIDAGAVAAFAAYLESRRAAGDWNGNQPDLTVARYLMEQIGLALTQRAGGEDPALIRSTLELAFSPLQPS